MSRISLLSPARLMIGTLVLALAGGVTVAAQAMPHDGPGGPGMGLPGAPMLAGPGLDRMLDRINATAEQRTQIRQITDAARNDLLAQRDAGRALRDQMRQLFTQPNVDANAAEALRQQLMARHDQASKRMLQAMLDVSRVLTPEQRQQVAARLAERRSLMERHRAEREALEGRGK